MPDKDKNNFSNMLLSHVELYVKDIVLMEKFYTENLGFIVTDRGEGPSAMVFLSRNPEEHHQIVLNPRQTHQTVQSPIDHISFRVKSISDLRGFNDALTSNPAIELQTVSHGTTWSLYFRDPETNRFEIFTDTPWYVNQPCKFQVNLAVTDEDLIQYTKNKIENMPGFSVVDDWKNLHTNNLAF
jgi:catechol-2,3-dioxygenase